MLAGQKLHAELRHPSVNKGGIWEGNNENVYLGEKIRAHDKERKI